jgi:hypothetical protein
MHKVGKRPLKVVPLWTHLICEVSSFAQCPIATRALAGTWSLSALAEHRRMSTTWMNAVGWWWNFPRRSRAWAIDLCGHRRGPPSIMAWPVRSALLSGSNGAIARSGSCVVLIHRWFTWRIASVHGWRIWHIVSVHESRTWRIASVHEWRASYFVLRTSPISSVSDDEFQISLPFYVLDDSMPFWSMQDSTSDESGVSQAYGWVDSFALEDFGRPWGWES